MVGTQVLSISSDSLDLQLLYDSAILSELKVLLKLAMEFGPYPIFCWQLTLPIIKGVLLIIPKYHIQASYAARFRYYSI